MAHSTQKTPLTRIDDTGATTGQGLIYDGEKIGWDDVATGSVAAGFQTKHTITATQTVSSNQQYQVFGTLNLTDGGTITLSPSADLVLDAPDDPNKGAGWTRTSGTQTIATDHAVETGNITATGTISAQNIQLLNDTTITGTGVMSGQDLSNVELFYDTYSPGLSTFNNFATVNYSSTNNSVRHEYYSLSGKEGMTVGSEVHGDGFMGPIPTDCVALDVLFAEVNNASGGYHYYLDLFVKQEGMPGNGVYLNIRHYDDYFNINEYTRTIPWDPNLPQKLHVKVVYSRDDQNSWGQWSLKGCWRYGEKPTNPVIEDEWRPS